MLQAKRRAIEDLEAFRQRHLVELQTRLEEQRAMYSDSHPLVLDLQQTIESLKTESPQLLTLRQDEAELRKKLAASGDDDGALGGAAPSIPPELLRTGEIEDPAIAYAAAQLQYAARQYAAMRERVDAAKVDLDTAEAAFKYRYNVISPPQVPRGPIKPKAPMVMLAAVLAGLFLALLTTTAADVRSGLLLETWQLGDIVGAKASTSIIEVHLS
jgi:hypothetical protein